MKNGRLYEGETLNEVCREKNQLRDVVVGERTKKA